MQQICSLIALAIIMVGCTTGCGSMGKTETVQAPMPVGAAPSTVNQTVKTKVQTAEQPQTATASEIQDQDLRDLAYMVSSISEMQTQKGKQVDLQLSQYKPTVVRGKSTELRAVGKDFPLQSVEITPQDGISVQEIKEVIPDLSNIREIKKDIQAWSITVFIDETAQLGERSVVLITPQGRSKPATMMVATHAPAISNLKILSAKGAGVEMEFTLSAFDEARDLENPDQIRVIWLLLCDRTIWANSDYRKGYTKKDGKIFAINMSSSHIGSHATGVCDFEVKIEDKNGYMSNPLRTKVEFK